MRDQDYIEWAREERERASALNGSQSLNLNVINVLLPFSLLPTYEHVHVNR